MIETVSTKSLEDNSIIKKDHPWSKHPLGNSIAVYNPKLESEIAPHDDFPNVLRARAISSLLQPLLNYNGSIGLDVSIILDSDCWKKSLSYCSDAIEEALRYSDVTISFSCENSKKAPGLQIADLIAGISKNYFKDPSLIEPYGMIARNTIHHIGPRSIPGVKPLKQ